MRKALITTGVILLVLFVTSLQSFASEICVCIDKKGNMKFSESGQCKTMQSPLCWNTEGPALYVVDADGNEVGLLIEFGTIPGTTSTHAVNYVVFYEPLGLILRIPPHTGNPLYSEWEASVYFDNVDCDCNDRIYFTEGSPGYPFISGQIFHVDACEGAYKVVGNVQNYDVYSELASPGNPCQFNPIPQQPYHKINLGPALEAFTETIPTFNPPLRIEVR